MEGPASGGRQAVQVAAGILLTRLLGYVRQRAIAYYIGNGWAADALSVAQRIPNAVRNLLGEGTLSPSFIPVYAALNERADKSAARALAGAILGLLLLATGALALIGIGFAPALTTVFGAGLSGDSRALAISLMRLLFPMSGLMVVSAWCLGVLNTHRRFFLPYAAPAVWNIAGIAALVAAGTWLVSADLPATVVLTRLSLALAWGTVAGSLLQVGVQLPACWRVLHGLPIRWNLDAEGVRHVVVAWLPVVLGAGVAQISGLIDTLLGTLAGEGGASSLQYAQLLQLLPVSLFGTSVAAVSLPDLSRDAQGVTPNEQLRARIAVGFRRICYFVLPSALAFLAVSREIVGALYQTGRFGTDATTLVGRVLAAYGIGLIGQATVKLFASGFYALRDTRTPVKIAAASLVVSTGLAWLLMRWLGAPGIALGSSIGALLNTTLHLRDLGRRIGRVLGGADWRAFALACGASVVAAGAAYGVARLAGGIGPVPRGAVVLAMFGIVYAALTLLWKHPDAVRTWQSLTTWRAR